MVETYAQILKANGRVNLIGDKELGLYLFDLPLAYTVDITEHPQKDVIEIGMIYNKEINNFSEYIPPVPEEPVAPEAKISETEEAILSTAIGVEYLICMSEI